MYAETMLDAIKETPVKAGRQHAFLFICQVCWLREQTESSKYVNGTFKKLEEEGGTKGLKEVLKELR